MQGGALTIEIRCLESATWLQNMEMLRRLISKRAQHATSCSATTKHGRENLDFVVWPSMDTEQRRSKWVERSPTIWVCARET
eukprot:1334990-Amphidinium_carterae.1